MKTLRINNILKKNNKVEIEYFMEDEWNDYINSNLFFSEYDVKIEEVPDSISIIPFICNILPISWIFNLNIEIDELDKEFYDAIPNILNGYKEMYPKIDFHNNLKVKKIITNEYAVEKNAVLFSGGVDAQCTFLRHYGENPDMITIFGSDIKLTDAKGINTVNTINSSIAKDMNVSYETIFSNFREIINYVELTSKLQKYGNYEWWHEIQHGIGLIGLVAPLSYVKQYKNIYIASSFCYTQKGTYTCASDPTIDNYVKYGNTSTIHDGYEIDRQEKVEFICKKRKELNIDELKLRVCWITAGGENCCKCEKCYRTMLAILVEDENPQNYFFNYNKDIENRMMKYLKKNLKYNLPNKSIPNYKPIQDRLLNKYKSYKDVPDSIKWFAKYKIGRINNLTFYNMKNSIYSFLRKIKHSLLK